MIGRRRCVVCWRWAGRNLLCRKHRQAFTQRDSAVARDAVRDGSNSVVSGR